MHSCYQFYFVSLWLVTEVICILKCVAPPTFLIIKMSISVFFLFLHTRTQIRYSNGSFSGSYYLFLSKQLCVPTWDQVHDVSITLDFVPSRRWGGNESGEIIPCFVLGKESHTGKWYITHLVATYNRCLRNCKNANISEPTLSTSMATVYEKERQHGEWKNTHPTQLIQAGMSLSSILVRSTGGV